VWGSGHTRGRWRRVRHREGCSPLLWAYSSSTNRAVSTKGVLGCEGDFEKMLYDNAQLARVYLHAWQVTGEPFYRAIVKETLAYVVREMASPEGGVPTSLQWTSIYRVLSFSPGCRAGQSRPGNHSNLFQNAFHNDPGTVTSPLVPVSEQPRNDP
jgi:hypothetical protein